MASRVLQELKRRKVVQVERTERAGVDIVAASPDVPAGTPEPQPRPPASTGITPLIGELQVMSRTTEDELERLHERLSGEPERAVDHLRRAVEQRERVVPVLGFHPVWQPLSGHARFQAVFQQVFPGRKLPTPIA
jgi:hypothetical protein